MAKEDPKPLIGRTIAGKFAIEAYLGGGAMGSVFRARQVALDKTVAIKVLHRELTKDPMFSGRFLREAKAASRIDHPCSMRVIDFGEEPDGILYIAMEYLDGVDLFTVLQKQWPLAGTRIVDILGQVLAALAVAHDMGVVHRDLKPENIMVLQGTDDEGLPKDVVKVCDFGIAKITNKRTDLSVSEGPRLTTAGLVVGTPEYMSPEQGRGEALDARSDLYSIGVILFQMLTAKVPFDAETALGIVLKHVTDEPPRPSSLNPAIDARLESICLKAMRKKRDDRYQTAREMRADLRAVLDLGTQSVSMRLSTRSSRPTPEPVMENAATAVAIDSAAVRAAAGARATLIEGTRPETETALEAVIPKTPRWPGFAIAAVLLAGTAAIVSSRFIHAADPGNGSAGAPSASASASLVASNGVPSATPSASPSDSAALAPLTVPSASAKGHGSHGTVGVPSGGASAAASGASSAAPSATPSAAPSAPVGPPYDPSKARVVQVAIHPLNTTAADVMKEINLHTLSQCYSSALLGTSAKPATAHVSMHLETDDAGRVNAAELTGDHIPPAAGNCAMKSMMGKVIRADGGSGIASANVDLSFLAD